MASSVSPFTVAHRLHIKSLYKRFLVNSLNWSIQRDAWRKEAIEIRAEFERFRDLKDARAIAQFLTAAEVSLAKVQHPDPYIIPSYPGGTKWERNLPPPMGKIFDHKKDHRDSKVRELIEILEESRCNVRATLDSMRADNPSVDGFLTDYPGTSLESSNSAEKIEGPSSGH